MKRVKVKYDQCFLKNFGKYCNLQASYRWSSHSTKTKSNNLPNLQELNYWFDKRLEQTCFGRFILRVVTPFFRVSMSKSFWEAILTNILYSLNFYRTKIFLYIYLWWQLYDVSEKCQSWISSRNSTILKKITKSILKTYLSISP